MNLINKLPQGVTRAFGKLWLKTKKASPEICVVGGIVCGAGALILVGVNTWKNKDKLQKGAKAAMPYTTTFIDVTEEDKKKLKKKQLKKIVVNEEGTEQLPVKVYPNYKTMSEAKKDALLAARIDFAKDICKTYWLPVTLEVASGFLIWKGRTILRKDLTMMAAKYAGAMEMYRQYRKRVAEKYGKEADEELALGYSMEEHVNENGKVEKVLKADQTNSLNPYGFFFNEGIFDKNKGEWYWRNYVWAERYRDKNELIMLVRQLQEDATRTLRTIGYWRLESTMIKFGLPPKEAAKFHDFGKVWKEGSDNRVDFGVLDDDSQLEINKGFMDPFCSQNVCYINPDGVEYIGYINEDLEKYDRRYGIGASGDAPYISFNREANRLIQRYNKEKMEQLIFNNMSDIGKRKMAKILK